MSTQSKQQVTMTLGELEQAGKYLFDGGSGLRIVDRKTLLAFLIHVGVPTLPSDDLSDDAKFVDAVRKTRYQLFRKRLPVLAKASLAFFTVGAFGLLMSRAWASSSGWYITGAIVSGILALVIHGLIVGNRVDDVCYEIIDQGFFTVTIISHAVIAFWLYHATEKTLFGWEFSSRLLPVYFLCVLGALVFVLPAAFFEERRNEKVNSLMRSLLIAASDLTQKVPSSKPQNIRKPEVERPQESVNAVEVPNNQLVADPAVRLQKIKKMFEEGLIAKEDFDEKKKQILAEI